MPTEYSMQSFEKFMAFVKRLAKDNSDHGAGVGKGFDPQNPLLAIFAQYDAENLRRYCQKNFGDRTSLGDRFKGHLHKYREHDGVCSPCRHDAVILAALLDKGRAGARFLPQLKRNLTEEGFVEDCDFHLEPHVGLFGHTVTGPTSSVRPAAGAQKFKHPGIVSKIQARGGLKLKSFVMTSKKIVCTGGNRLQYDVQREVRRLRGDGKVLPKVTNPKPHGDSCSKPIVLSWVKQYWAHEADTLCRGKGELKGRAARDRDDDLSFGELRFIKKFEKLKGQRVKGTGAGGTLVSKDVVEEFLRLRALYPKVLSKLAHPEAPAGLDVNKLEFESEANFDGNGWPASVESVTQLTNMQALEETEQEGSTEYERRQQRAARDQIIAEAAKASGNLQTHRVTRRGGEHIAGTHAAPSRAARSAAASSAAAAAAPATAVGSTSACNKCRLPKGYCRKPNTEGHLKSSLDISAIPARKRKRRPAVAVGTEVDFIFDRQGSCQRAQVISISAAENCMEVAFNTESGRPVTQTLGYPTPTEDHAKLWRVVNC